MSKPPLDLGDKDVAVAYLHKRFMRASPEEFLDTLEQVSRAYRGDFADILKQLIHVRNMAITQRRRVRFD